ncbi:MAG TPA: hypothetical protein ENO31_00895, partial [Thermoprotei archaeon]|nr:hypothetical protein [Thermoprotei archaeon]
KRKSLTIRYDDNRTFKFYPDSRIISLTTVQGRLVYPVAHAPLIEKYRGECANAQALPPKSAGSGSDRAALGTGQALTFYLAIRLNSLLAFYSKCHQPRFGMAYTST